jgi:hypothetical protein
MPYFKARNKQHHEIVIEFDLMSWEEFQAYLTEHPDYESILSVPGFVKVN